MTYQETLDFLYAQLPVFESQGAHAYKPGLERVEAMDELLGHPHRRYKTIHVAGTNGKGSTCHLLASILQAAGYKVGLFTSPHLVDFSERIRVNGKEIDHQYVVEWTEKWFEKLNGGKKSQPEGRAAETQLHPSFFELANMMAFCYFADQGVDVAVVEVGLGGRLDSTNIIRPILSIITNISMDHTQFLGNTLPQIAAEKAGIMKEGVPCLIGECTDERVRFTFGQNAQLHDVSRMRMADERRQVMWVEEQVSIGPDYPLGNRYTTLDDGTLWCPLTGACQPHNANTVVTAVQELRREGFDIGREALAIGFRDVLRLTHLRGRWETLSTYADGAIRVLCDTGHNEGCFSYIGPQLQRLLDEGHRLHVVFGMVSDKDIPTVLRLLPQGAAYYFCNAPTPRALPAAQLAALGHEAGLMGEVYGSIDEALDAALSHTCEDSGAEPCHNDEAAGADICHSSKATQGRDIVFVGGSNFVVCEAMKRWPAR